MSRDLLHSNVNILSITELYSLNYYDGKFYVVYFFNHNFKNSWEISLNMEVVTREDRIWGTNFPAEIEAESSGDKNPSHQGRWTGPVHLCDTCTLRCSDARLSSWLSDKESTCQRKRWVPPLVQEDLTCLGAMKPAHHNY